MRGLFISIENQWGKTRRNILLWGTINSSMILLFWTKINLTVVKYRIYIPSQLMISLNFVKSSMICPSKTKKIQKHYLIIQLSSIKHCQKILNKKLLINHKCRTLNSQRVCLIIYWKKLNLRIVQSRKTYKTYVPESYWKYESSNN